MKVHRINIPTDKENFLLAYLHSINGVFGMTPTEIEVVKAMLELNTSYTATPEIRKELVDMLEGVKSTAVLGNYVKSLKDKQILIPSEGRKYTYNPVIVPTSLKVEINFVLDGA